MDSDEERDAEPARFLRVGGTILSTGVFEADRGWETERISRGVSANTHHLVEVLTSDGDVTHQSAMRLEEPACGPVGDNVSRRLVGYVAFDRRGSMVRVRDGERVLHEASIPMEPPRIDDLAVQRTDRHLRIRWSAEGARELTYSAGIIVDRHRAFPVVRDGRDEAVEVDLMQLPEGVARVVLLASDGVRSSSQASEEIELPGGPATGWILEPQDGAVISPLQPVTLTGGGMDAGGEPLGDELIVWLLDGNIVHRGSRMALVGPLEPGTHRVDLRYAAGDEFVRLTTAAVTVRERTPAESAWFEANAKIDIALQTFDQA
jgi:hypothetical protein